MNRVWKWLTVGAAAIAIAALCALAYIYIASGCVVGQRYAAMPTTFHAATGMAAVKEGHRLARAYGCTSCHDEDLHGGYDGYLHVTVANLTRLSPAFRDADFERAIRQGLAPDGTSLAQEMPSDHFRHLPDSVLADIVAFIRAQPPGGEVQPRANRELSERWNLLQGRSGMVRARFASGSALDLGPRYAQGRRIAISVCAICHGSALTGGGAAIHLSVPAPDLALAAAYSETDFQKLLRTGKAAGNRELPVMSDAARGNFRYLSDAEIHALYRYLAARGQKLTASP
ncbi:MAG TPA: c-type cytochrome [Rhizomicrobium sp.]